jgi:putative redox protein
MTYHVSWKDNLVFEGTTPEGLGITMDASPEFGGEGNGPRPAELLLLSLGGCTGMDVMSILKKKRADVKALDIEIEVQRATDHPKVFTEISVQYIFEGNGLKEADINRAIELSTEKYCVVGEMLEKACTIQYSWKLR